jgi:hypothetical protein
MPVKLHRYGRNNVKVSTQWLAALRGADKARVGFTVNSGARTEAEQKRLIALKGCWSPSNTDGAACPWNRSNHVIKGRANHAIDVQTGGEQRLQNWLNSHRGVVATNPVPGEPWHLEINQDGLRRLYYKYRRLL